MPGAFVHPESLTKPLSHRTCQTISMHTQHIRQRETVFAHGTRYLVCDGVIEQ